MLEHGVRRLPPLPVYPLIGSLLPAMFFYNFLLSGLSVMLESGCGQREIVLCAMLPVPDSLVLPWLLSLLPPTSGQQVLSILPAKST